MEIVQLDPPDRAFYAKQLDISGTLVKAHADVADEALLVTGARIARLLEDAPVLAANLAAAGAELHVICRHHRVTDLPMYRHMAGVPYQDGRRMDQRARGYGGLHACVSEESVLCLPSARHADHRDVASHEFAHTVLTYGLDAELRSVVEARYEAAKPRWRKAYASTNVQEFFAELTMWYVGSRGDYTSLPSPAPGPEWLAEHDPESYELLDAIYSGRLEPAPIAWVRLGPTNVMASTRSNRSVSLLFVNETDAPIERYWLDYRGERKPYGPIPAGSVAGQSTYATHPWLLVSSDGADLGVFMAGDATHGLVRISR